MFDREKKIGKKTFLRAYLFYVYLPLIWNTGNLKENI